MSRGRAGMGTQAQPPAAATLLPHMPHKSPHVEVHAAPSISLIENRLAGERRRSQSVGECCAGAGHWGWVAPVLPGAQLHSPGAPAQSMCSGTSAGSRAQGQPGKEGQRAVVCFRGNADGGGGGGGSGVLRSERESGSPATPAV